MEIPVKEQSQTRHKLIPCSYEDYLEAGNGNLPERLLNAYQRFE
jgi:formiminoglutamase